MLSKIENAVTVTYQITSDDERHRIRVEVTHDAAAKDPDKSFASRVLAYERGEARVFFKDADPDDILAVTGLLSQAADVIRAERDALCKRAAGK